jgi:hypothetical protein
VVHLTTEFSSSADTPKSVEYGSEEAEERGEE